MNNRRFIQDVLCFIMKITLAQFLLMVTFTSLVSATSLSGQAILERKVSVDVKDQEIKAILSEIEKQASVVFTYRPKLIGASKKISFTATDAKLEDVLEALFSPDIAYLVVDKEEEIVLKPRETADNAEPDEEVSPFAVQVTGKVTDAEGQTLPGVNVLEKGTTNGTTTDVDGRFALSVEDASSVLVFSFIGYQTQEISVGNQTDFSISLETDVRVLEEVVVGYGEQKKVNVTGSLATVDPDKIAMGSALRVDQMLQGRVSGVMVTSMGGAPGAASTIRIRGNSSITASSEPLYVVDGLIGGGDLNTINPSDIESITVLKDASTTAIYGSQGANGVILITTKKGKLGPSQINLSVQQGAQWLPRKIPLMTGPEYAQLLNESRIAAGAEPVYPDPSAVQTTDWQEEVTQTAPMTNVNATYNGGSEKIRYFISGNYFDQEGIIKNSGVERLQFRTNLEGRISNKVNIGVNLNAGLINRDHNTVSMAPVLNVLTAPPSTPVYYPDGSYHDDFAHPNFNGRYNNPVAEQNLVTNESTNGNLMINTYVEYFPFDWLTVKSTYGGQMLGFGEDYSYTDSRLPGQTTNQQFGRASISHSRYASFQNENTLNFTKQINDNHYIEGVLGVTFQGGNSENFYASAQRFMSDANMWYNLTAGDPMTRNIGSGYANWSMNSYLGRFTYRLKDRYLLSAVARQDGSSRLGEGNKWAFFPSVAVGWIVSEESFLKDMNGISFLKLKASYGKVGNQAVGIYQTMSILTPYPTIVGNERVSGWLPGNVSGNTSIKGNPDLTWEVKDQFDVGFQATLFNGRVDVSFDYYKAITRDLLLLTEIPSQTGYTQQMSNIGEVSNTGFEISINSLNVQRGDFTWSTDFAFSQNENEVLKLGPTGADIVTHTYTWGVKPIGILRIGEPVGSFYGYMSDGIWKENQVEGSTMVGARAGSVRYQDVNGDGIVNVKDNVILGNGSPKFYGGIGNNFSYKGVGLSFFLSGALGAKIFNANAPFMRSADAETNQYREVLDRWHPVNNPDSNVPGALNSQRETSPSDRWVFDADYIRLESVTLSYALPLGGTLKNVIKKANVNVTGNNLFCLSPYNDWGYDPVIHEPGGSDLGYRSSLRGFDYGAYPRAASFTVGLDVAF